VHSENEVVLAELANGGGKTEVEALDWQERRRRRLVREEQKWDPEYYMQVTYYPHLRKQRADRNPGLTMQTTSTFRSCCIGATLSVLTATKTSSTRKQSG
jgi:hypothetical protein